MLDFLSKGDVLMVTRLDRLARSTRDLLNVLATVLSEGQASGPSTISGPTPQRLTDDGVDRAAGPGLGVGPDLGCAGVGDFLAVRRAAISVRGQPSHSEDWSIRHGNHE